ncbi:MAG: ferritin family protein [Dehalococcoidia bacterium]|nr:ferritin family protein [Dehalococcoidia bacterium]
MSEISIGKEFLELAIEIEKNGRFFYEVAARLNRNKEIGDVFAKLAAREREHENNFHDMLSRLGGYRPYQKQTGEHYQYIRDLAETSIFAGERAQTVLRRKSITDVEALEIGIAFEKDSILFYSEMRGMMPRQDQEIVDVITSEEKKHLSELVYMAGRLRGGA